MRNLILFLALLFSSVSFGQTLNDIVNFDSLNINLINTEVFKRINEKREHYKLRKFVNDTVPTFSAKYHLLYFKKYNELVDIHNEFKPIHYDLTGKGYKISSSYETPNDRLWMAEKYTKNQGILFSLEDAKYRLIKEKSFSYSIGDKNIEYSQLIDAIIQDIFNEPSVILSYSQDIHFGLWNEHADNKFAFTYIMTDVKNNE